MNKNIFRDIAISAISLLQLDRLFLWRQRKRGPLVRILAFHDVTSQQWFAEVLDMCLESYAIISPEDFNKKNFNTERLNILLTFDDGYESWVTKVLPELQKRNLKGLFFVSSGLLDAAAAGQSDQFMIERLLRNPKPPLTWPGLSVLHEAGQSVGGHTVGHKNLAQLDGETIKNEIEADKQQLEDYLGVTLNDFAYPFGTIKHINARVHKEVVQSSYLRGYSAQPGFVRADSSTFCLPRLCLINSLSVSSVRKWASGCYDIMQILTFSK